MAHAISQMTLLNDVENASTFEHFLRELRKFTKTDIPASVSKSVSASLVKKVAEIDFSSEDNGKIV